MLLLDVAILATTMLHLWAAPYTKVEESFNMQAIYDFLNHKDDFASYDHHEFPGSVQRTFVGSGLVAAIMTPFADKLKNSPTQMDLQLVARGILGLFNGLALIFLRRAAMKTVDTVWKNPELQVSIAEELAKEAEEKEEAEKKEVVKEEKAEREIAEEPKEEKSSIASWFAFLQIAQFHVMFYSSRFIPNSLALPFTNIALGLCLRNNYPQAFTVLSFTAIVFRSDVAPLAASLFILSTVVFGKAPFFSSVAATFFGVSVGGLVSFIVDSKLWGPETDIITYLKDPALGTIPEITAFIYNVVERNASKWGTSPFSEYFNVYLRKIFFPPTVISLLLPGFSSDPTGSYHSVQIIGLASLAHIFLMSFQPHKELRFILYSIPGLTLLGASGAAKYWKTRKTSLFSSIVITGSVFSTIFSLLGSLFMLFVSSQNYPGGTALSQFNNYFVSGLETGRIAPNSNYTVHLDVYTKMTGATLFGELQESFLKKYNVTLKYDKSENLTDAASFDYYISNTKPLDTHSKSNHWNIVYDIKGYYGLSPAPLFVNNKFDPLTSAKSVVEKIIMTRSLDPVMEVINEATLMITMVWISKA